MTYAHPFRTLRAEAKALKAETDTGPAGALIIRILVAFLVRDGQYRGEQRVAMENSNGFTHFSTNSTRVAATLRTHCTFGL